MATYWVVSSGGSDANPGTQSLPFATIKHSLDTIQSIGLKGDIVNVVNDGTHTLPSTGVTNITNTALLGTSFNDPGFTIRGVDSSGNPAFVSTQSIGAGGTQFFRLRAGVRYAVIRGMDLNLSPGDTTAGMLIARMRDSTAGPVLIEACRIKGFNDSAIGTAVRSLIEGDTTGPSDYGEIRYCYLENCLSPIDALLGSTTKKLLLHHNVVSFTGDWINGSFNGTLQAGVTPVNSLDNVGFYFNTIYVNGSSADTIASIFDWGPALGDAGTANFHSNYGWIDGLGNITQVIAGGAGSTATFVGTVGFNTVYFGPNVVAGDNPGGLYEAPWDGGVDPKATDDVLYTQASSVLFNDVGSSFLWSNINGTGYNITLPRDLRPKIRLTSSISGGIPGALPGIGVDMVVDIITSNATPLPVQVFTVTVTASCSGGTATSVTYTSAIPVGVELLTATPSVGSYNSSSGVWTIGSLVAGFPQTLLLLVRPNYGTDDRVIVFNASVTAYTPSTDPDLTNNTDSVTITVATNEKRIGSSSDSEKVLAAESAIEKILVSVSSTEKALPSQSSTEKVVLA